MAIQEELIERLRTCDRFGSEELLLLFAAMGQGQQLDPTSLIVGLMLGKKGGLGGHGADSTALTALLLTSFNANAQQQAVATGGVTPAPQAFNPLMLLALLGLGRGDEREVKLEIMPKEGKAK
jgi:hypothetical protein